MCALHNIKPSSIYSTWTWNSAENKPHIYLSLLRHNHNPHFSPEQHGSVMYVWVFLQFRSNALKQCLKHSYQSRFKKSNGCEAIYHIFAFLAFQVTYIPRWGGRMGALLNWVLITSWWPERVCWLFWYLSFGRVA